MNAPDQRKVVHCKRDKFDIYIGRPSKWGNPYTHIKNAANLALYEADTREDAIAYFERDLLGKPELIEAAQTELRNKVLGCFCAPQACHGDVLTKYANSKTLYRLVSLADYKSIEAADFVRFVSSEFPLVLYAFPAEKFRSPPIPNGKRLLRLYLDLDYFDRLGFQPGSNILSVEDLSTFNTNIIGTIQTVSEIRL
jgi:hypothetical protein